jgi:hypothetical protein
MLSSGDKGATGGLVSTTTRSKDFGVDVVLDWQL